MTTKTDKMPADNERFGATAAGRADLKGSAEMPPLTPSRHPVVRKLRTVRADNDGIKLKNYV